MIPCKPSRLIITRRISLVAYARDFGYGIDTGARGGRIGGGGGHVEIDESLNRNR